MTYTNAQLQQLWINAGGSAAVAPTMAAIAQAESGGNPTDVNSSDPGGSYGLWQINAQAWPQYNTTELLDPNYNAYAATQVYAQQGPTAWSTYTNNAYQQFLAGGSVTGVPAGAGTSVLSQVIQSSDNPLVLLQNWIAAPSVNVLYKAFAFVFVLIVLGAIPQTSRFAMWAALIMLLLLMVQENGTTPATSATISPSGSTQTV